MKEKQKILPYQRWFMDLLAKAELTPNGSAPWDPQIKHPKFFQRILLQQELGLGEAYMEGWWDCGALDEFFYRLVRTINQELASQHFLKKQILSLLTIANRFRELPYRLFNYQKKSLAYEVGKKHYDIGNDLFSRMLDEELNYTCGYWLNTQDLAQAQRNKLRIICEKLRLQPGQKILDIGCGWGAFARFAAKHYQVEVVGITISKEQQELAQAQCKGLPIDIRLQDYRDVQETFDHVVSIGMFEHVGYKNYGTYFQKVHQCLKDNGLFLLHTIGNNFSAVYTNRWIQKYIFPNGMLPSITQIGKSCENLFIMEDWHNFGVDYDKTLLAWNNNFNHHWDDLKTEYGPTFQRMWNYYLLSCAGAFRARDMQLWQIVLSKNGLVGGYQSIR